MFETTLVGNQPKISDDRKRVNLRSVRNRFDKGVVDADQVVEAIRGTMAWTIADQVSAGMHRVTDGRIRWDDPATPFAAAHDGFTIGGLIRYFDNNMYYRRPAITGPIGFRQSAVADDFQFLASQTGKPVMASVCGPFSLAKFCVNEHYGDTDALYSDCAMLVRRELEVLASAGAKWVQLDEPFLGMCPDEIGTAVEAITAAVRGAAVSTFVFSYFCDLSRVVGRLWDLPVSAIGADCATVPGNFDCLLQGPKTMGRGFGIVNARTTRMESPAGVTQQLDRLVRSGAADWPACWITPSAGLEFLPYKNAQMKMRLLSEAVEQVAGAAAVS